MSRIIASDFSEPDVAVELIRKSLHGGFLSESELTNDEEDLCQSVSWMDVAVKFSCECGEWHASSPQSDKYQCPKQMRDIEPDELRDGYRKTPNLTLELDVELDYQLDISESTSMVDIAEYDEKAMVFLPDVKNLDFPDGVGRVVWLPIESIPKLFDEQGREELMTDIRGKRETLIDWTRLDNPGNAFEEVTYRLLNRDERFYDSTWGGRGADQGKDALCSIDLIGRETRVLVQAKYNLNSGSQSRDDIRDYVRDAKSHDCGGLLLTTIHVSGDAETTYENNGYQTDSVSFVKIWSGVDIKEELSVHPDLIAEFFIQGTST